MSMKRATVLSLVLLLGAAAVSAQTERPPRRFSNALLNDVVRMTDAGLADETITAFVKARRARLEPVTADDLIRLRQARVSDTVIQYLASVEGRSDELTYDSSEGTAYPVSPTYSGEYGYAYPYSYYYPGYFSSFVFFRGRPFFRSHSLFHRPFFRRGGRPFFHGHGRRF